MSNETNTPSAAKLRLSAATIASDIAHAPIQSRHHETLHKLNGDLIALEKTMASTSDTLTLAIAQAQDLVMESHRWSSTMYNSETLRAALDHSLISVSGEQVATASNSADSNADAMVSSETAHP